MINIPKQIRLYIDDDKEFNECYVSLDDSSLKIAEFISGFGSNKEEALANLMSDLESTIKCCQELLNYKLDLVEEKNESYLKLTEKV